MPFLTKGHVLTAILSVSDLYCYLDNVCRYFVPSHAGDNYINARDWLQEIGTRGGDIAAHIVNFGLFISDGFAILFSIYVLVASVAFVPVLVVLGLALIAILFFIFSNFLKKCLHSDESQIPIGAGAIFFLGQTLGYVVSVARLIGLAEPG